MPWLIRLVPEIDASRFCGVLGECLAVHAADHVADFRQWCLAVQAYRLERRLAVTARPLGPGVHPVGVGLAVAVEAFQLVLEQQLGDITGCRCGQAEGLDRDVGIQVGQPGHLAAHRVAGGDGELHDVHLGWQGADEHAAHQIAVPPGVEALAVLPAVGGETAGSERVQLPDLVLVVADGRGSGQDLAGQAAAGSAQMLPQRLIVRGEGAEFLAEQVQLVLDDQGGRGILDGHGNPLPGSARAGIAGQAAARRRPAGR